MDKDKNDDGALGMTSTSIWPGQSVHMGEMPDSWAGVRSQKALVLGKGDQEFVLKAMRRLHQVLKTELHNVETLQHLSLMPLFIMPTRLRTLERS